ncbi:MAG: gamma-glutamylputrescine oxidase [Patiriisocius sp.]|jgi:gamma-glutamylputrescine oxidase
MAWSYWEKSVFGGHRDVLIIGAGITGLNAALNLKIAMPEWKITVVERGVMPAGASTKNAGFACFGSLSELLADEEKNGIDSVLNLVEKRWTGLQLLRQNLGDENIDYQEFGGYEMFKSDQGTTSSKCLDAIERYNGAFSSIIGDDTYSPATQEMSNFGFTDIDVLIKNKFEGQINTGMMMKSLLQKCLEIGIEVQFGLTVKELDGEHVRCEEGIDFSAEKIIVTTNGFAKNLLDLPVKPARAQVLVTKPIENLKINGCFHYDEGYYYFRNIDSRLLIGGGRNIDIQGEETTKMFVTEKIKNSIIAIVDRHILKNQPYEIDYAWSGIMGVGEDKSPIIKMINENTAVAVKLGGMGIAIGSLVGKEVADLVLGH